MYHAQDPNDWFLVESNRNVNCKSRKSDGARFHRFNMADVIAKTYQCIAGIFAHFISFNRCLVDPKRLKFVFPVQPYSHQ